MKKIFTLIALIFILASCTWKEKSDEVLKIIDPSIEKEIEEKVKKKDKIIEEIEDLIVSASSTWDLSKNWIKPIKDEEVNFSLKWQYSVYSKEKLKSSSWNKVLFFHAEWCGSCKTADTNFSKAEIPVGLNILKVNYDDSKELRKKYWIITQHTFVEVDENWKMIKKWVWGKMVKDILENIEMKEWHDMGMAKWKYVVYSDTELENSKWNKVLFFHATWCPSCKSADTNFSKAEIPSGLNIFKVNYDSASELKKKYSVLAQHTFVQIDKEWNMVKKMGWMKNNRRCFRCC